jgi:hypothetical protein
MSIEIPIKPAEQEIVAGWKHFPFTRFIPEIYIEFLIFTVPDHRPNAKYTKILRHFTTL